MGMKCGNMTTDLGIYRDAVSTANTLIIMEKGNLIEKQQICLDANSAASRSKFLHFKSVLTILALCLCMVMGGEAWGQTVVFSEDFESNATGWTMIDADGDGNYWFVVADQGHNASAGLRTNSYQGGALTPDNWAITPLIDLSSYQGVVDLKYFAAAQDEDWASEHYGVYICTSNPSIENFVLLGEETMDASGGPGPGLRAQGVWGEKHVDLTAYVGQRVYIAFRHFNVSDVFALLIDDITVTHYPITISAPATYNCGESVNLTASVTGGSVPAGYNFHWYADALCTIPITTGISGVNNSVLTVSATYGTRYYCRLEGADITRTVSEEFGYSGSVSEYTVPDGAVSLKLEVWGAQGGNGYNYGTNNSGGKGGYYGGTLNDLSGISKLYVYVGGQGSMGSGNSATVPGGYNGGGSSGSSNSNNYLGGSGGGATHIATSAASLTNDAQRNNVLIVAGGGGGNAENNGAGCGGGVEGTDAGNNNRYGKKGTSTTGGAAGNNNGSGTAGNKGLGGNGYATTTNYGTGGGGGGWYGGGGGGIRLLCG